MRIFEKTELRSTSTYLQQQNDLGIDDYRKKINKKSRAISDSAFGLFPKKEINITFDSWLTYS
jgi:hypothetical protein